MDCYGLILSKARSNEDKYKEKLKTIFIQANNSVALAPTFKRICFVETKKSVIKITPIFVRQI